MAAPLRTRRHAAPGEPVQRVELRLPVDQVHALDEAADVAGSSRNVVASEAIGAFLEQLAAPNSAAAS